MRKEFALDAPGLSKPLESARSLQDEERSLSSLLLGFRFFALAAVSGIAGFMPHDRVSIRLVVFGVLAATAVAWIQHLATPFVSRRVAIGFAWLHVAAWTFLVHATGGQGSPLVLGYLLELPLSGALLGRAGIASVSVAAVTAYGVYAVTLDRPIHLQATAILVGMVAVCSAITWRVIDMLHRERTTLDASRARLTDHAETLAEDLRRLGDTLGDALVTVDAAGRVMRVNPSGAILLGVDPGRCLGKPWQEVIRIDAASRARVADVLDTGIAQRGTMVITPSKGGSVTVCAEMWRGGRGGRHLHLLLDSGSGAVSDDPMRRLGESAACVAHQIKNSMHSIQGHIGRLRHSDEARAADECLGALRGLGDLAEDVLTLAGTTKGRRERVAIQNVLRSAIVLLDQPPIQLALPSDAVYVEVPRSQLVHAVFNVLDNAVQVTPPGEAVRVRVEHRADQVIVDIADAGPGLPMLAGLATAPLPSTNGSGLGLLAARQFLEACGGCLSFMTAERGGTLCRLQLPAAPTPSFAGEG